MYYITEGEGKAIIFLHGFLESSTIWKDFIQEFSSDYKCIAPDLPGHGKSQEVNFEQSLEVIVDMIFDIMKEETAKKAVFVGHSMGGYVSLAFAKKYPDYVSGLCLFHSNAYADDEKAKENRLRTIEIIKKGKANFIASFIPDLFAPHNISKYQNEINQLVLDARKIEGQNIIDSLVAMMSRESGEGVLDDSNFPIGFIIGKKDKRANLQQLLKQISLPKTSLSLIMEDVGHMGWLEDFSRTKRFLRSFIEQTK